MSETIDSQPDRSHRPRERLTIFGPSALSDVELLALVLGGGHAVPRAIAVLQSCGGLDAVSRASAHELMAADGIGTASATAICAVFELARRLERLRLPVRKRMADVRDVARFVRASLRGATQEVFWVIGLDARQQVCRVAEVGRGTVAHVAVHPREVFAPMIRSGAHTCILAHNHPSGVATPSPRDIEMTQHLCRAADILGIPVLDHVIVTDTGCCSLSEAGYLAFET